MKESPSKPYFAIALIGLVALLGTAGYLLYEVTHFYTQPPEARFEMLWQRDLQRLREAHVLPAAFDDLQSIELTAATERAKEWQPSLKIPVATRPNGHFRLEILLITWEEAASEAAIVQYNVVDLKSQDMVWELGRTFILQGPQSHEEQLVRQVHSLLGSHPPEPVTLKK